MQRSFGVMILALAVLSVAACGDDDDHDHKKRDVGDAGQLPDKTAGKGCKRDSDCPNGMCVKALQIGSMTESRAAPGGYCTTGCTTDSECGEGGQCSVPAGSDRGMCLSSCHLQSECRTGYVCVGGGSGTGTPIAGSCEPMQAAEQLGDRVAGRACASDGDCLGGSCASTSPVGAAYPGNYCTGRCWADSDCGEGGGCIAPAATSSAGWCYETCSADTDCDRSGYRCMQLSPSFKGCFPAPKPLEDGTTGKACKSDDDCGGQSGTCVTELPFGTFSGYEDIAAPGGYCTLKCSLDSECGTGAQCVSHLSKGGLCLKQCATRADCREGYGCELHGKYNMPEDKACVPREIPSDD